jgi:hypothetical protein
MAKTAVDRLADARAAHADALHLIAELEAKRSAALLKDDDKLAAKLAAEIDEQRRVARGHEDKIALLAAAAAEEERGALQRRRAEFVERFEATLAEADDVAAELQELVAQAEQKFRRVIALREKARAAWPRADAHHAAAAGSIEGCAMSGGPVRALLSYEIFRIGSRPFMGGESGAVGEPSFPGGVSPGLDMRLQPEKIVPFAERLRQASAFAVAAMRDKLAVLAVRNDAVPATVVAPSETAAPPTPGEDAQGRLAALLLRQRQLADLPSPTTAEDAEYVEVVRQIAVAEQFVRLLGPAT